MSQQNDSLPPLTVLSRLGEIPALQSYITIANETVLNNVLAQSSITAVQSATQSIFNLSGPLKEGVTRAVTIIDGVANSALDRLEESNPALLQATTEDVNQYVSEKKDLIVGLVLEKYESTRSQISDKVNKERALEFAQSLDEKAKPILDNIQNRTGLEVESQDTQYLRALELSKAVSGKALAASTETLKALREQANLVERANQTTQKVQELVAAAEVPKRVQEASSILVSQLVKLQESPAVLAAKERAGNITVPPQVLELYVNLSKELEPTIAKLREIVTADAPASAKLSQIAQELNERVGPQLAVARERVTSLLARSSAGATPEQS